jgi:hypothetical protein
MKAARSTRLPLLDGTSIAGQAEGALVAVLNIRAPPRSELDFNKRPMMLKSKGLRQGDESQMVFELEIYLAPEPGGHSRMLPEYRSANSH